MLVIDDEPLIRWSVAETLSTHGCVVSTAASGAEARRWLDRPQATAVVVVADLRLPDVSDLSLIRDLRALRPAWPVVVTSAVGPDDVRAAALALGVAAFVDKPYDLDTIVRLVLDCGRAAWGHR